MGDSIKFTIGGQLGGSYRGALSQAVAESRAANQAIHSDAQKQMALSIGIVKDMSTLGQFKQWKKELLAAQAEEARLQEALRTGGTRRPQTSTDLAADAALIRQNGLIRVRVAEIAAEKTAKAENDVAARASLERLQIIKKENAQKELYNNIALAQIAKQEEAQTAATLLNVARGYGASVNTGGGHGTRSLTGIIRESLVIVRELSQGRGTGRVAGSVTLLAQYLGLLGKVVKSTAAEALLASQAESKLAQSMAQAALAARGKVQYAELAAAAMNQEAKAAKAAEEAEIALAAAKTTVSPFGWVLVAGVAIVAVLGGILWHMHTLATRAKNLADMTDKLHKKFTDLAAAEKAASGRHQEYLDFLIKIGEQTETLSDQTEVLIRKFKEQSQAQIELARAKGETKQAIEKMEEAQLREELRLTTIAKLQARRQEEDAADALAAADAANNSSGEAGAELQLAQNKLKNQGEIMDALQAAMEEGTRGNGIRTQIGTDQGIPIYSEGRRAANESDEFTVKVGGKEVTETLGAARKKFADFDTAVKNMENAQKKLQDTYNRASATLEERHQATLKFNKAEQELQDQLGIKTTIGRQIAAAGMGGKINSTDWERAGGAFGGHTLTMLDIGKQQLNHLRSIDRKTGPNKSATRGVNFGDGHH